MFSGLIILSQYEAVGPKYLAQGALFKDLCAIGFAQKGLHMVLRAKSFAQSSFCKVLCTKGSAKQALERHDQRAYDAALERLSDPIIERWLVRALSRPSDGAVKVRIEYGRGIDHISTSEARWTR